MVDLRIYRALLVLVAFAVIVFAFSLQNGGRLLLAGLRDDAATRQELPEQSARLGR